MDRHMLTHSYIAIYEYLTICVYAYTHVYTQTLPYMYLLRACVYVSTICTYNASTTLADIVYLRMAISLKHSTNALTFYW